VNTADQFVAELVRRDDLVSDLELKAALEAQDQAADEFGEIPTLAEVLVERGVVAEDRLCLLQAEELVLPVRVLKGLRVGGDVLSQMTREQVLRYKVMPTGSDGDTLQIAVADPLNLGLIDELVHLLGCPIDAGVASLPGILSAIERHYGGDGENVSADTSGRGDESGIMADEGDEPTIRQVHRIIAAGIKQRASDIHLEPLERSFRVRYRVDGRLQEGESPPKRMQLSIISRLKIMADLSIAEKRLPQDGRIQLKVDGRSFDFRVSTVATAHGESVVMRILDQEGLKPGLAELGLNDRDVKALKNLVTLADGMVLVTGPTGSGKTTTLYSCLHDINKPERKIITVEDPVEYQLSGVNQVPVRPDVGLTFAAALRAMLRQAPNVVMVGEIRDRETAEIAINASLTGHLVFSTLHTNDAPGAVTRLVDLGVKPFLVASSLRAAVAQRLVRRICPSCRRSRTATERELRYLNQLGIVCEGGNLTEGAGCETCSGTGYAGRVAIFEFFVVSPEIERLIHAGAGLSKLREHARRNGMRTLREDGLRKAVAGITTIEEVIAATTGEALQNN
jgi:type IV pilus assembly protein PilB